MSKRRSSEAIDSARSRSRRKLGELNISTSVWKNARDIFFCKILARDPFPDNIDDLAEECYKEAIEKDGESVDTDRAAIQTVRLSTKWLTD